MKSAAIALVFIATLSLTASAEEAPDSKVVRGLLEIVRTYADGKETLTVDGHKTTTAFDAMTYMIHKPLKTGRMQKAWPELGPRKDGIVLVIEAHKSSYLGQLAIPTTLTGAHSPYYPTHCNAVREGDTHYYIRARIGGGVPDEVRGKILERMGMGSYWRSLQVQRAKPALPVTVTVTPERESYAVGEPLLVRVRLRNGLRAPIYFLTFSKTPLPWHGETQCIEVPDIYRDGKPSSLYLARPEVRQPMTISGIGRQKAVPGGALYVQIDLAKWKLRDGWLPGTYEIKLRLDHVQVDERVRLDIYSEPFQLVVK